METTTELKKIKLGKHSNFTWGEAICVLSIGEYAIVEYHPHEYVDCCSLGKVDYSQKAYSCYVNGNDIGKGSKSLDLALATCIAYKHDDCNSQAAHYFMKMVAPNQ